MDISIVIPVYNEEESVAELAHEVTDVMSQRQESWECLWIDDGSSDATLSVLQSLHEQNEHHTVIAHDGNFGQSAAMATGFIYARGNIIITLDGDGQNDPHDIPNLLARLAEGNAEMVNGIRAKRRDSIVRKLSSRIANGIRRLFLNDGVTDVGCSLRAMKREAVQNLPVFKGMHRFLPALARGNGCRCVEIPVAHRPRMKGVAKYGVGNRLWVGIADLIGVSWWLRRSVQPRTRNTSVNDGSNERV